MSKKNLEQLVVQMENYVECWKQFNSFIALARTKKYTPDDENQFLEIKSVMTQELELILEGFNQEWISFSTQLVKEDLFLTSQHDSISPFKILNYSLLAIFQLD